MKRLMIVGASVLQLPAIIKAKEMGLYVGVADYNPRAVGIQYADEFFNASTMDEDAVLQAAEQFKPDGIMTLATDMPMRGVSRVSDKMHLHSISYETSFKATDKYEMIKAFKAHGVPSPWYFVVDSIDEIRELEGELSYPCIIKPTDNAGSHGVAKVYSFEELLGNYDYSHSCSRKGRVIIEEYLDGPEVSVEVMVVNGNVHILQITDKITTGAPHFVEMGHSQPSQLSKATRESIARVAIAANKAIGIKNGPSHTEIRVTKEGPKIVELGARLGGDCITTHLVPLSTGVNMVECSIRIALGEKPDLEPKWNKGAAIRYLKTGTGTVREIKGIEEAESIPGVIQVSIVHGVGERVG